MGVYLECVDYDADIRRLPNEPIILNDLEVDAWSGVDLVKLYMVNDQVDDTIEILPTCNCTSGGIKGRYNARYGDTPGVICPKCQSEVISPVERGFLSDVWLQTPDRIEGLMRLNFIRMMREHRIDNLPILDYFCNTKTKFKNEHIPRVKKFLALDLPRGYNNFIIHFDRIFSELVDNKILQKGDIETLQTFVEMNRKLLFPHHIPLPSKRSIITEQSDGTTYALEGYNKVLSAARDFLIIKGYSENKNIRFIENLVYSSLVAFAEYTDYVDGQILSQKTGWWRKQIFGSRLDYSYRAVITGHNGEFDSIKLPWRLSVGVYKPMIIGQLIQQGAGLIEAERIVTQAMVRWDIRVRRIFDKLIRESFAKTVSGVPGLPQMLGRNPTLDPRSIQALIATEIKDDLHDNTISIPYDILNSYNADKRILH